MRSGAPDLPIPSGVAISAPGPGVPAAHAAFLGQWGGFWGDELPSILIVESVAADGRAQGYYLWGTGSQVPQPGTSRFDGQIAGGALVWGDSVRFSFSVREDGSLGGTRWAGSDTAFVRMIPMS